ncbi:MAG: hypothetical protein IPF79_02320 [Ignavibacteria bacterium]|nr:hypothetical protein [Ignavibacteria bacterium]
MGMIARVVSAALKYHLCRALPLIMNGFNERVVHHALSAAQIGTPVCRPVTWSITFRGIRDAMAERVPIIPEFTQYDLPNSSCSRLKVVLPGCRYGGCHCYADDRIADDDPLLLDGIESSIAGSWGSEMIV